MDTFNPLLLFAGLIVGLLAWSRIAAWTIGARSRKAQEASGSEVAAPDAKEALRMSIRIAAIWLFVFVGILLYAIFSGAFSSNWLSFLGGAAVAPCMILISIFVTIRRIRKRKNDNV